MQCNVGEVELFEPSQKRMFCSGCGGRLSTTVNVRPIEEEYARRTGSSPFKWMADMRCSKGCTSVVVLGNKERSSVIACSR